MDQKPRVGSAVLIQHNGKFLLGRRNKINANGMWVIPGGGVDFGETTQQAAVREIKEETGLDIELIKFLCHKEIINLPGNYHGVVFFYLAKLKNNSIKIGDDLSDAKFFSIDEIKKLNVVDSVKEVLEDAGFWR